MLRRKTTHHLKEQRWTPNTALGTPLRHASPPSHRSLDDNLSLVPAAPQVTPPSRGEETEGNRGRKGRNTEGREAGRGRGVIELKSPSHQTPVTCYSPKILDTCYLTSHRPPQLPAPTFCLLSASPPTQSILPRGSTRLPDTPGGTRPRGQCWGKRRRRRTGSDEQCIMMPRE